MNNLIKKILVSEKSFQAAASGKYTFIVDKKMSKDDVSVLCGKLFNVEVLSAHSMNYKGKVKTVKRKTGVRNDFKKVILTLKPGDKIDLFETEAPGDKGKDKKAEKKEKKSETPVKGDVEITVKKK